jgi:hypothetical protein
MLTNRSWRSFSSRLGKRFRSHPDWPGLGSGECIKTQLSWPCEHLSQDIHRGKLEQTRYQQDKWWETEPRCRGNVTSLWLQQAISSQGRRWHRHCHCQLCDFTLSCSSLTCDVGDESRCDPRKACGAEEWLTAQRKIYTWMWASMLEGAYAIPAIMNTSPLLVTGT